MRNSNVKPDTAGNFRINLLIVITDIRVWISYKIFWLGQYRECFIVCFLWYMTMISTVQITLVIIVPNQRLLNMNTQWSTFSPLQQEKPILIRTPQPESKPLKRKILVSDSPPQLDEDDRKTTPKRKKPLLNSEMSPTHHGSTPVSKAPSSGITSPRTGPLSERQQMLFLMKMTDDSQGLYYWFHQRMVAIKHTCLLLHIIFYWEYKV